METSRRRIRQQVFVQDTSGLKAARHLLILSPGSAQLGFNSKHQARVHLESQLHSGPKTEAQSYDIKNMDHMALTLGNMPSR